MDDRKPVSTPVDCGIKLSRHDKENVVDATLYKSLVGSLWYLTCTRPDILYAVSLVSRYMGEPRSTHWKTIKLILHYIRGTLFFDLFYSSSTNNFIIFGYSDNDWGGDMDDRKSTSGFAFYMGDTTFKWFSKKQPVVILSTYEAEYVAAACVCHAMWLRRLLKEINFAQHEATSIYLNSKSTIELAKNSVHHERSKHIDVKFYFIREQVKEKKVELIHMSSDDQVADIFTKPLPIVKFEKFKNLLGMKDKKRIKFKGC
jgi:hypothetical protein